MKTWSYILLFSIIHSSLFSGEIPLRFNHFSDKNGLPHNYTFNVVQDKKGFIWIGTNNGLARYDGYTFKVYQPIQENPNSLAKKPANLLYIDSWGNLWVNFRMIGLNKLNLEKNTFTYYTPDSAKKYHISGTQIRKFYEDKDSALWIVTEKGIEKYDPIKERFISVLPDYITKISYPNYNIYNLAMDKQGNIWFRSTRGIGLYMPGKNKVISLGSLLLKPEIDLLNITSMIYDNSENLWFITQNNGLYNYKITTNKLSSFIPNIPNLLNIYLDKKGNLYVYADEPNFSLFVFEKANLKNGSYKKLPAFNPPNSISIARFAEDKTGNIWLGSYQGLEMYNPSKGTLTHFQIDLFSPYSLIDNQIESIFIDNMENLWISMHRRGLQKADLKQKPFNWFYSTPLNKETSIAGNIITAVYGDKKGVLWIGCSGDGLTLYNPKTNHFKTAPITSESKINKFPFTSICEDSSGFIWIGYSDDNLDRLDPKTFKTTRYSGTIPENNPNFFKGRGIRKIVTATNGNLWMASMIGLIEFDSKKQSFFYHSALYDTLQDLSSFCRTVYIDKQGIVWAGTNAGGLIKYNPTTHKFKHFQFNAMDSTSIKSNTVYSIFEENMNKMWIGTSSGLNIFDKSKETFISAGNNQNLNKYSILSISPDKLGRLWLSTDNGLICYIPKNNNTIVYKESDGLLSNEFTTTASYMDKHGQIFLGTPNGLISFNPIEVKPNPYMAKPTISNFLLFNSEVNSGDKVNGRVLLNKQISSSKRIELYYYETDFTLEFTAMHFASPDKIQYWYKLEGFNNNWIKTTSNRHAVSYAGLQPGTYIFKLKATNNDGLISSDEDEATLEIVILPPFWKTIWFQTLLVILILSGIVVYIRMRTLKLQKTNSLLEHKVNERTSDLKEANSMLEERQEEINLQKEELMVQRDNLEDANKLLTIQQNQILEQNKELDKHRNELTQLVEERTRELVKALYKAEESDRLKSAFLANMSHEIRTPMNAILGFSSLLMQKTISEEEKSQYISIINKNGKSLMVLINDIIDISLIQSNQLEVNIDNVNLLSLLTEINAIFSLETKKRNLKLIFNPDNLPDYYQISTDSDRLKQIFSNLLTNAIKFTQEGEIEFGIKSLEKEIIFYVKDSGIGIPPEAGESIFDRFIKLEKYKDKLYGGTGLGLAISKSLVEFLGGKIWYESELKTGTTFFFTHPASKGNETGLNIEENQDDSLLEIPDLTNKKILIAEDEDNNYRLLNCYLLPTNAEISWALNGKEAIEMALNNSFDIILMDIKMPVLNGIEAIRKIKKIKPEIPIIAQTAFAYKTDLSELSTIGVENYIVKPIKQADLLKIVKKLIG